MRQFIVSEKELLRVKKEVEDMKVGIKIEITDKAMIIKGPLGKSIMINHSVKEVI